MKRLPEPVRVWLAGILAAPIILGVILIAAVTLGRVIPEADSGDHRGPCG